MLKYLWSLLRLLFDNRKPTSSAGFEKTNEELPAIAEQDINVTADNQGFPIAYDENLLEKARTQWQFGDWQSLAQLNRDTLQHHPDRAKLALLAAAGRLQTDQFAEARQFIRLAQNWGISKKLVSQIFIAGVHNTLGRIAAIGNQRHRALQHFENAITIGTPGSDAKLITQARIGEQLNQLGLPTSKDYLKAGAGGKVGFTDYQTLIPEKSSEGLSRNCANFSSAQYWEDRYQKGGTSGYGSYGRLAQFKAQTINNFIESQGIESIIEFGCGDGNQLSMFHIKNYVGVDISPTIVQHCRAKFQDDRLKAFYTSEEYRKLRIKCDLALSLDVVFHLIEDNVFSEYMETLFNASNRYCIIYSSGDDKKEDPAVHVRHRKFTDWVAMNMNDWRLRQIIYNKYPHDGSINPKDFSFSDFYIFERTHLWINQ